MRILQTVKYYAPSKGGMESVVEDIVEGVTELNQQVFFTVYSNSHHKSNKKIIIEKDQAAIIKEVTPLIIKSQPVTFKYAALKDLIVEHDIIHHHYPFPNMEMALLRHKHLLKQKKLIITWHANIKNSRWGAITKYYNPIIKRLLNLASQIVVTSQSLLDESDILQDFKSKVSVIPLSFSPSCVSVNNRQEYNSQKANKTVLFVGKLRAYKGVNYFINAVAKTNYNAIIVGDGEQERYLQELTNELGLTERIKFLKNITNEELKKIYQVSDLFVLPSINEAEAFGVVQLEAMANGLPVINTHLKSGVPYVSLDGISGFTVQPANDNELAASMIKILENSDLYHNFSKNAIERATLFSREKLAEQYLNLYMV